MIRLRPFEKVPYNEMRKKYLEQLVEYNVVEFDDDDVLMDDSKKKKEELNGKSQKSYEELADFPRLRNYLYDDNKKIIKENLRQILVGPDEAPRSLGGKDKHATMRSVFNEIIFNIEGESSDISEVAIGVCKKIFKYKQLNIVRRGFSQTREPMAYWLQSQLDVKVCPYCNRMYTTTLYGKKRIRPDFDHFYPRSRYPYLAVSLFNLIPSCNVCNKAKYDYAEMKEAFIKNSKGIMFTFRQKKSIIYPYDESYNESKRRISFRVIADKKEVFMGQSDNFTIELRPTEYSRNLKFENLAPTKTELNERFRCEINSETTDDEKTATKEETAFWERAKQTIELLRLESFYNEHKLEVKKILRIHYEYNQIARQLITLPLNSSTAKTHMVLLPDKDLQYFAFMQPEEWGNSPLNKLKSDILAQLKGLDELDEIEDIHVDL